ncbi:MAG: hypothetical protein ACRD0K_10100 [Egibacteraceae bacterium]
MPASLSATVADALGNGPPLRLTVTADGTTVTAEPGQRNVCVRYAALTRPTTVWFTVTMLRPYGGMDSGTVLTAAVPWQAGSGYRYAWAMADTTGGVVWIGLPPVSRECGDTAGLAP